jgi:hypothetical protein
MRTVFKITFIVLKMFTIPAAAAVVDQEPQLRISLRMPNLLQSEDSTASTDSWQFDLRIPHSGLDSSTLFAIPFFLQA